MPRASLILRLYWIAVGVLVHSTKNMDSQSERALPSSGIHRHDSGRTQGDVQCCQEWWLEWFPCGTFWCPALGFQSGSGGKSGHHLIGCLFSNTHSPFPILRTTSPTNTLPWSRLSRLLVSFWLLAAITDRFCLEVLFATLATNVHRVLSHYLGLCRTATKKQETLGQQGAGNTNAKTPDTQYENNQTSNRGGDNKNLHNNTDIKSKNNTTVKS